MPYLLSDHLAESFLRNCHSARQEIPLLRQNLKAHTLAILAKAFV